MPSGKTEQVTSAPTVHRGDVQSATRTQGKRAQSAELAFIFIASMSSMEFLEFPAFHI
jgi:hypothetical protein